MTKEQFIKEIFEIAAKIMEYSDNALKWEEGND